MAVQFTPTYDTALDRLTVGTYYYANRDLMRVSLMTNDVDGLPGDVLETFTGSFGQFGSPPFFDSTLHTQLDAGVQYWIAVEAAETDSLGILNGNNLGITQSIAHYAGSAFFGWEHTGDIRVPAMRVEATAIPEPASLGLLGTIGAIALRRGRKN